MTELGDIRNRIDTIDAQIVELFSERMKASDEVAAYKRAHGLATLDPQREKEKLSRISERVDPELRDSTVALFSLLMEASKARQNGAEESQSPTYRTIQEARKLTPEFFPRDAVVACQGVEGAYSQLACNRLFRRPTISYHNSFDGVFRAVEAGEAAFGVLPVENSTAGTVSKVYDLMMSHDFSIVRTVRLKVDHNLMARPGTRIEDITDIYSHEQAIAQCRSYLDSPAMRHATVHVRPNTAMAAKMVAEDGGHNKAALCSRACAAIYGLTPLAECVQDQGANFTRFACISKHLQIFPGADRTSLMLVLHHEPGALFKVLARFFALGINLVKLESRPIPERDFEFMFYFDLECPVAAPEFRALINSLEDLAEDHRYLGSYLEQV